MPRISKPKIDIEKYFNSLPDDTEYILVSKNNLTYLPSLSRFKKLKELFCYENKLTSLPPLPENLRVLKCEQNKLTSLPLLPESLEVLNCRENNLTCFPPLPNKLKELRCDGNMLKRLPDLPKKLQELTCSFNNLTCLPELPTRICQLAFRGNKISYLNMDTMLYEWGANDHTTSTVLEFNRKSEKIHKFRELYYTLKFKTKFRDWLWLKVREPAAKKMFNPDKLLGLTEEDELDLYLENLGWKSQGNNWEICV